MTRPDRNTITTRAAAVLAGGALVATPLMAAVPAAADVSPTAPVVISEVYGGGGNTNGVLNQDFVELRNTSDADVSVDGWAIQYSHATGGAWQVNALTGTIAAGDTLLVGMFANTDNPSLPGFEADQTGTSNLAPGRGKVALTNSATALTCTSGCASEDAVVDFLGYGDANDFAGSAPSTKASNKRSVARDAAGTNTADNAADFTRGAPTPQPSTTEPSAGPVSLSILSTNDFHGRIDDNTVAWAGTVEEQRAEIEAAGGASVFVGAGDLIGASLFASAVQQDQPTIDVLNAVGLDTSAVGNHEFDQGFADLTDRVIDGGNNAEWVYLGANVYGEPAGQELPEYVVTEVNGVSVGVIGVVTEDTPSLVSPGGIQGLTFGDPVEAINRVAAQLTDGDATNGEAQVIVATSHEGAPVGEPNGTLEGNLDQSAVFADIVENSSPAVDILVQGHTHQEYAWLADIPGTDAQRPVIQTGQYGANIGRVDITYDAATDAVTVVDVRNVPRTETDPATLIATYPSVAEVDEIVKAALANANEVGNTEVGSLTADITTAFGGGSYVDGVWTGGSRDDRSSESTIGDLVADALVDSLGSADRGGATIGVVNPGGLRSELLYAANPNNDADSDGTILYAEANAVLPFNNNLWTTSLTGAQFLEMLEQQWQTDSEGNVPSRPYLQLGLSSNVTYTFDADPDGDGVLVGDPDDQGSHITSVTIDGEPLDEAASYRIGSFSFLLQGGDNFRVFTQGSDTRDSGLIDRDAWIDFISANSPLSPDFARQAAAAPALGTVAAGEDVSFEVGQVNLTSLGSPENTTVEVALGDVSLGSFELTDGAATITVTIPADAAQGESALTVVAQPSGTTVTLPVTIEGSTQPEVSVTTSTLLVMSPTQIPSTLRWWPIYAMVTIQTSDWSPAQGVVELRDGDSLVSVIPVRDGVAWTMIWPGTLRTGTHEFTATFIPNSSDVGGSTSSTVNVTVN